MAQSEHPPIEPGTTEEMRLHGLLAEYENVDDLVAACERVRDAGYTKWDAHTPFPVHGIDEAMGVKPTILPWIVLGGGLTGLATALLMQWWMNAVDYPYLISGKPYFSLPAFIPVCFELTVLFSALTTFLGVLMLNLLPQLYHPLFRSDRFKRATDDRFFISVEASDPQFDRDRTWKLLAATPNAALEEVLEEARPKPLPRGIVYGGVFLVCLTFVPLAYIARARFATSDQPRVHLVWDMDWQPRFKTQTENPMFADRRAMRPPVAGTVARGEPITPEQIAFVSGRTVGGDWLAEAPVPADPVRLARGRERFDIYCAPCHGLTGVGDGMVARRADRLAEGTWVPPLSLHSEAVVPQPAGQIFATITNGIRTMPSYGDQIDPADRWAIVHYIRALQRSRSATLDEVPAAERRALEARIATMRAAGGATPTQPTEPTEEGR